MVHRVSCGQQFSRQQELAYCHSMSSIHQTNGLEGNARLECLQRLVVELRDGHRQCVSQPAFRLGQRHLDQRRCEIDGIPANNIDQQRLSQLRLCSMLRLCRAIEHG